MFKEYCIGKNLKRLYINVPTVILREWKIILERLPKEVIRVWRKGDVVENCRKIKKLEEGFKGAVFKADFSGVCSGYNVSFDLKICKGCLEVYKVEGRDDNNDLFAEIDSVRVDHYKRNVEVEGVRAEISRRLMTAVNGIKNAVETSVNGKKRKKNTGIPYAIKLNSGCIEICQFRISFDTLLPPSSYKMLNVDNLRINWRNTSILEPFDVVDGETDVVYVDDSLLGE
jgi:hypothetical protein